MTSRSWKRSESSIAALIGGKRLPVPGRSGPDIDHPTLAVEVKSRKSVPASWRNWLAQATAGAPDGKVPVVVIHELNKQHSNDLVLLKLHDFVALLPSASTYVREPSEL